MHKKILYNPYGYFTLFKREISRFLKVSVQTLFAPLLSNILFLGVFGGAIGSRTGMEGVPYLVFLVPGLCAMGAIFAAYQNPAFSLIAQKFAGTIQDLNSYPITVFEKVLAFVAGGTLRGFLIALMTYAATLFFVRHQIQYPLMFIGMITGISFIFSCLGLISGLIMKDFDSLNFILSIILTPLVYFGGVFFDISGRPGLLYKLALWNPIYPLIKLTRYSFTGGAKDGLLFCLIVSFLFLIASFAIAYMVFRKGIGIKE